MEEQIGTPSTRSKMPPRGWMKARRAKAYQGPPRTRFRKLLGGLFNTWTLIAGLAVLLFAFLTITYFWLYFSDDIDRRLLSEEVFTPSAGIYTAPKLIKKGDNINAAGLIEYLKTAGYIEKNNRADVSRSRFSMQSGVLLIEPGATANIDGKKTFNALSVAFDKNGDSIKQIRNLDLDRDEQKARLEPRILSSLAAEGDGRRKTVNFDDLPPHLVKAITVTEDRAFFDHFGVNFRGIARALWRRVDDDAETPLSNQGGSSITQQLVKNLLLNNDPTYERKAKEAFMSVILETRLTKQEIFTLYANQIYLGQQTGVAIYGVGEAANVYFGKDVSQLNLPEAAFIAGIIRSPNRYNPFKNTEKVQERRNQVLESMFEAGEITGQQYEQARSMKLELKQVNSRKDLQGMPYFTQYVVDQLPEVISDPEALQHLRVYTSIDPDLQRIAYETVAKRLDKLDGYFKKKSKGTLNAALVAMRPKTGEIVAMVGGRDYLTNQFNRATSAMRQPGSVFKPFVYAAALNSAYDASSRVFTAATTLKDEKKIFTFGTDTYAPNNYGDTFSNKDITVRDALVKSKNTVTVDIGMQVNIGKVMNLAAKAGMPKVERAYPSMALGTAEATPLQVATAYTTFANLGDRVLPLPITQLTTGDGYTRVMPQPDKKNVIRPDVAYIMDDIMKDVINRGTAAQAQGWGFRNVPGKTAFAGKTGTSRDGWFAGFTPDLVCVVYVGFDENDDLGMKGSDSAMPIWADFMKAALDEHPEWNGDWSMPMGIRKAEIDTRNGALIRELDGAEATITAAAPSPTPKPSDPAVDDPAWAVEPLPEVREVFASNVPAEFRRVELFISGTVPNRQLLTEADLAARSAYEAEQSTPSPTPVDETWEEELGTNSNQSNRFRRRGAAADDNSIVIVCPVTGMRATSNCPLPESRSFPKGMEPADFCTFHR